MANVAVAFATFGWTWRLWRFDCRNFLSSEQDVHLEAHQMNYLCMVSVIVYHH